MTNLADKYRPKQFVELWQGLETPVIEVITLELAQGALSGPLLVRSPYGGGKTSLVRLIGLRAACLNPDAASCEPCLSCKACTSITRALASRPLVIDEYGYGEIDCTRTPAGDILHLIQEEKMISKRLWSPGGMEQKVLALDEFGRLSMGDQKRFLKILETGGAHLILCVADEDKIDEAVANRCLVRRLPLPSIDQCVAHIRRIVESEGRTISPNAARLLAQRCGNVPRDTLLTLSDAMIFAKESVDLAAVEKSLKMRSKGVAA